MAKQQVLSKIYTSCSPGTKQKRKIWDINLNLCFFFLSFSLFKPIKITCLFYLGMQIISWMRWLTDCCTHTFTCNSLKNWTSEWQMNDCCFRGFQNTKEKTAVYSERVILQRPIALLIFLNSGRSHVTQRKCFHQYNSSASLCAALILTNPRGLSAIERMIRFTLQKHRHDEIYSLIGRGAEIIDRQEVLCSNWCSGSSHWWELNVSFIMTLLFQVYNHVTSPFKYRYNTSPVFT